MIIKDFYFKKIRFFNNSFKEILSILDRKGGYLVAPAASALVEIDFNKIYHKSLMNSDIAILDSGFFCILIRIFYKIKVVKYSGYKFLKDVINEKKLKKKKFLLVDPNKIDSKINYNFFKKNKFSNIESYVAPDYKVIKDKKLLRVINQTKPNYIIINIGGLKQEPLALFIKKNINFKLSIFCTGAAIAFFTKRQAPINDVIDKYYLGWAARLLFSPATTYKRFIKSFKLIKYFIF